MIVLLTPDDFLLCKTIWLEAYRLHPEVFISTHAELSALSDEYWMQRLKVNHVFAYLNEGVPVGFSGYAAERAERARHRAAIVIAYVRKDYRGKGIMDWLLGATAYHARDTGVEQLHLGVASSNESALHCYERNGFAVYATEPRNIKLKNEYIDVYRMVKYL